MGTITDFNLCRVQTQKYIIEELENFLHNCHIFSTELLKLSHESNSFTLKEAPY